MNIPTQLQGSFKIIGYFSYTNSGNVFCDGDACIIAGSEEEMQKYLSKLSTSNEKDIIKKTRFGEIISGMKQGGAYAFDEVSYNRFYDLAKINGMEEIFAKQTELENPEVALYFVKMQIV